MYVNDKQDGGGEGGGPTQHKENMTSENLLMIGTWYTTHYVAGPPGEKRRTGEGGEQRSRSSFERRWGDSG